MGEYTRTKRFHFISDWRCSIHRDDDSLLSSLLFWSTHGCLGTMCRWTCCCRELGNI